MNGTWFAGFVATKFSNYYSQVNSRKTIMPENLLVLKLVLEECLDNEKEYFLN